MQCLFCGSSNIIQSYLPSTFFNNKRFDYKQCKQCKLIFINPIPQTDDLNQMYPPSYQDGVSHRIIPDPYQKLIGLRFSYGFQFDLLKRINFQGKILDFGCGNANFLVNCNHHGFHCDGAEYNPKHVEIMRREIPERKFFSVDEFISSNEMYDLIRLSNVLEHFTNPKEMMLQLKNRLKPSGYFLVEGPIEYNFNFALLFRKVYFKLRKAIKPDYIASHTPTHIIFTNLKNQTAFFDELGLKRIQIQTAEAEWPFPQNFSAAKGMVQKMNVLVAKTSMFLKKLDKNWGNTFIYLGQKQV